MTQLLLDERQRLKLSNIVVVQFLTERKKVKKNCLILKPTTTVMLSTLNFTGLTLLRPLVFWVAHPFESLRPLKKVQGSVLWLRSNENLPSIYNHKKVVFSLIPVPGITCSQKTAICVHSPDTYQHTPFGSSHAVSTTSRPYAKLAI